MSKCEIHCRVAILALVSLALAAPSAQGQAATASKSSAASEAGSQGQAGRLILTDGSFQVVREWRRQGERVRYLSAERGEWEELPASLIDWKATEGWNAGQRAIESEEMRQVNEEELAARKKFDQDSPQLAPGLRLPAEGGVFLFLDSGGPPRLERLRASRLEVNQNQGKTILKRSLNPLAKQVQTIEVDGPAARTRIRQRTPEIYAAVADPEGSMLAGDSFRIVRLERKKDRRVVAKNKVSLTGEQKVSELYLRARVESFSGPWFRLVPLEELTPGEYAIVTSDAAQSALVWDFGVDE